MSWVAAAVAGAAVVGGVASGAMSSSAAKSAANTQAGAQQYAADLQNQQFEETRSDLQPYRDLGTTYAPQIGVALANPLLYSTFNYGDFKAPTAADAQATPGYQFTLNQGLKAAQNSASARGLGSSGAAIKGAQTFASGLADATYGDTFNRALSTYTTNRNNALSDFGTNYGIATDNVNRLLGIVGNGQNAATQTGALGAQAANSIANSVTSGAAAQAAGTVGAANAVSGGISTAINGGTNALLLNSLQKSPTASSTLYGSFNPSYQSSYSGIDNPANYG